MTQRLELYRFWQLKCRTSANLEFCLLLVKLSYVHRSLFVSNWFTFVNSNWMFCITKARRQSRIAIVNSKRLNSKITKKHAALQVAKGFRRYFVASKSPFEIGVCSFGNGLEIEAKGDVSLISRYIYLLLCKEDAI